VYASEVSADSATLHARILPEGAQTSYVLEYGPSKYESPVPPAGSKQVDAGETSAAAAVVPVEVHLQNLPASTTFYYRVVAGGVDSQESTSFTTDPEGSEFALPDGRAWELVSPPDKYGGSLEAITHEGGVIQASENGSAITYVSVNPIVGDPLGNRALEDTQLMSRRGATGWSTEDIATPHNDVGVFKLGEPAEYKFFSPDLSLGLVEPKGETPLPPLPEGAEKTIYLRNDNDCASTPTAAIPATCYLALATAANVEVPGSKLDLHEGEIPETDHVTFEGASPDLSHVVFSDFEPLTKDAVPGPPSLYEWAEGHLTLVSVLPDGKPANEIGGEAELGAGIHNVVRHAVANGGSQVIWHASGHLYLRDMDKGETVEVDAPEPGGENDSAPIFQTASANGTRVFFTDEARLVPSSSASRGESAADLYVFEVTSGEGEPLAGKLTDLTIDPNFAKDGERAAVQGEMIGASEDGSYVYFVANGVLGDAAEDGAGEGNCEPNHYIGRMCNLYMDHFDGSGWEAPKFIATLSGEDFPDWSAGKKHLPGLTARVSPDGRWLTFMSDQSLTGFDNVDVNGGVPDEEVYLFDATTSKLACASCKATGERPAGILDPEAGVGERLPALLVDQRGVWEGRWLAGNVPGWTSDEILTALYQSRYLSNNGRLFFDSADGLVPADVNGKEDVYEFEPTGVGGCNPELDDASWEFVPRNDSCVGLISSGTSSQESAFLDASTIGGREGEGNEGGGDAFFLTASQLAPADEDQALDLYDAHECSTTSPCTPGPGAVQPACNTAESCRAGGGVSNQQSLIFGPPPSATFNGNGNVTPETAPAAVAPKKVAKKTVKCKKPKKLSKGKCVTPKPKNRKGRR
jgi:hypothetical protein